MCGGWGEGIVNINISSRPKILLQKKNLFPCPTWEADVLKNMKTEILSNFGNT